MTTITLFLGVNDIPYTQGPRAPRRAVSRVNRKTGAVKNFTAPAAGQQTTADVAHYLEDKYKILETFADRYQTEIGDALSHSVENAIVSLIMGAPGSDNPFAEAAGEIEESMRLFLDLQEMDGAAGVPTGAALRGVNHRLARPYQKRAARPSFIDTGLMQANYRAWTEAE